MLERVAAVVEPTIPMVPANILRPGLGGLWKLFKLGRSFQKLGPGMSEAVEVLTGAARPLLDRWFESEQLKATLATDAIIGAFAAPSMPGTAYVLFHHVMGETNGKRGVWAYVRGGMGGLTKALAGYARAHGVDIHTDADVHQIVIKNGSVTGVALACGDQDYIEHAYDDARYGAPSRNPVLECTMASAVDHTVAPPGKHLMSMFIQYAPYKLREGTWDEATKDRFADRCFDILEEYAPG